MCAVDVAAAPRAVADRRLSPHGRRMTRSSSSATAWSARGSSRSCSPRTAPAASTSPSLGAEACAPYNRVLLSEVVAGRHDAADARPCPTAGERAARRRAGARRSPRSTASDRAVVDRRRQPAPRTTSSCSPPAPRPGSRRSPGSCGRTGASCRGACTRSAPSTTRARSSPRRSTPGAPSSSVAAARARGRARARPRGCDVTVVHPAAT